MVEPPWDMVTKQQGFACVDASLDHDPFTENNTRCAILCPRARRCAYNIASLKPADTEEDSFAQGHSGPFQMERHQRVAGRSTSTSWRSRMPTQACSPPTLKHNVATAGLTRTADLARRHRPSASRFSAQTLDVHGPSSRPTAMSARARPRATCASRNLATSRRRPTAPWKRATRGAR